MHIEPVDDLGAAVGEIWREKQSRQGINVAVALSSTPLPVFEWVIQNAADFGNWKATNFVLMDEQVEGSSSPFEYVSSDDAASYEYFARRNLLEPLTAVGVSLPVLKPDLDAVATFDVAIDLLILAIGPSGNYANVMPGTSLEMGWHITELSEEFRIAHTRAGSESYEGASFRSHGMSLGPQQVVSAGEVLVVARGGKKRPLVERLLSYDAFDPAFPLSIIHHPDVSDRARIVLSDGASPR